ncbi:MAG: sodium:alanine symporter family protein [Acidobacteria bacterium]|nr:sodium:alanine symporter family protein [Acidobacteriota bacterium]
MMILDKLLDFTIKSSDFMWGLQTIALLLLAGVILTLLTRFVQITKLGKSIKLVLLGAVGKDKSKDKEGDITPFAALMTALAATVGNGNIAGVATAIASGGPGAPFWMWLSGFFGMATKYAEGYLGVRFRKVAEDGTMAGGPMYYIRYGLGDNAFSRFLGGMFAICGGMAALLGTGNMAQSNSITLGAVEQLKKYGIISESSGTTYSVLIGFVLVILVGMVIIGGIKRIGAVAEKIVPFMILFYFGGALIILIKYFTAIPAAFALIFKCAFSFKAVVGGAVGVTIKEAVRFGVARGVLSNEAGLGSASIAQSASKTENPSEMGLVAMTGVLIDTIIVNTLTTLSIILTGAWVYTRAANYTGPNQLDSIALTQYAWDSVFTGGGVFIVFASLMFGFTTLIGWSYYGEQCFEYLFGLRAVKPYRLVYILLIFFGAVLQGNYIRIVWNIGDTANAFMAIPNLIGLILLSVLVARETRQAFSKNKFELG